jgi:hypothetical protein
MAIAHIGKCKFTPRFIFVYWLSFGEKPFWSPSQFKIWQGAGIRTAYETAARTLVTVPEIRIGDEDGHK